MFPRSFDYSSPTSLDEALELLGDPEVKILAGGQSLIPSLKLRTLSVKSLIDITRIDELRSIKQTERVLEIGATVTVATLERDKHIFASLPILREAAAHVADPLVRNRGTVGGNLCHGDASNDLPAVMRALNASMVATSRQGTRRIDADDFFKGPLHGALAHDEILTQIEIPLGTKNTGSAYRKVRKGSGGFPIAGVAACLSTVDERSVDACRIAMTAVGPTALRAENAERALLQHVPTDSTLDTVATLAVEASRPFSDHNASKEFRQSVLYRLVKEAVKASYDRAVTQGRHG